MRKNGGRERKGRVAAKNARRIAAVLGSTISVSWSNHMPAGASSLACIVVHEAGTLDCLRAQIKSKKLGYSINDLLPRSLWSVIHIYLN